MPKYTMCTWAYFYQGGSMKAKIINEEIQKLCSELRKNRIEAEIPQRYMAQRLGVTQSAIWLFEKGTNDSLRFYLMYKKLGLTNEKTKN